MSATHACRLLVEREDDQFLYRDGWIAALLIVFMVAAPARIFAQGGSLDTTFGGVGKVFTDFGGFGNGRRDLITAVLTDAQERMIAVGSSEAPIGSSLGSVVALARYTSNGSLDPTFGSNGRATKRVRIRVERA